MVVVPASTTALCIGAYARWRRDDRELTTIAGVAVFAGLLGTLGYDLFRVPFVFGLGFRLLSPIESYGVLLLDAGGSSGATDYVGWSYHFLNGVGFALAYGMVAVGRRWWWGVAWAMVLETATLVTPFIDAYALRGKVAPIVIAYAAHVPYGLAVGVLLQDPNRAMRVLRQFTPRPALISTASLAVALGLWLSPWQTPPPRAVATVVDNRLIPEFVRTDDAGCVTLENRDLSNYQLSIDGEKVGVLPAVGSTVICIERFGVTRLRTSDEPFDGGFIING